MLRTNITQPKQLEEWAVGPKVLDLNPQKLAKLSADSK